MATNKWGNRIKAFRKLKGYTQIQFAEELGISVSQLGDLERGKKIPTMDHLETIANQLDISLDELEPQKRKEG
ncbi:helix-turn-helix transcriptional regulator [Gracilibacillus oryzae]|uniref:Helix-turn-helix transcriptional regulator n=1 Tax=Gracilibacillus oryzae TaxID=1672701 RepID=A0A7C8GQP8_9BACI|nr:helix-turn-helix transcriptional regulator [Gracilibacillus oryzae]KAB8126417.1 helix-turn-helix transcriptional regulator [Gracilibacillus oryzae]